jgi:hypothetical protein
MMRQLNWMIWVSEDLQTIRTYNPETKAVIREITGDAIPVAGRLVPWTFRYLEPYIVCCYRKTGRIRVRLWDTEWNVVADYDWAPAFPAEAAQTDPKVGYFEHSTLGPSLVLWNGASQVPGDDLNGTNELGVLSTRYAGVIPYADLDGSSLATGLTELSKMALCFLDVDIYTNSVRLLPRSLDGTAAHNLDFPAPLDESEMLVSEMYRTACVVSGTDQSGASVEARSGADPSRELDLDAKFVGTESAALALAGAYVALLSRVRRERRHVRELTDEPVQAMQIVERDGARWIVYSAETDLQARTQTLRLVEVL